MQGALVRVLRASNCVHCSHLNCIHGTARAMTQTTWRAGQLGLGATQRGPTLIRAAGEAAVTAAGAAAGTTTTSHTPCVCHPRQRSPSPHSTLRTSHRSLAWASEEARASLRVQRNEGK